MASAGYEESRKSAYKELGREEAVRKEERTDKLQNPPNHELREESLVPVCPEYVERSERERLIHALNKRNQTTKFLKS